MISETIRKLRKNHGLTQGQVAECIGMERSTYAYYENGRSTPQLELIVRLCRLYNVTMEYIIEGEDDLRKIYMGDSDADFNFDLIPNLLLTEEEKKLILIYRLCNKKHQEEIIEKITELSLM
ncbi:MAG: helix-turn-helix transcriptional regulator [Oscillospiraceae bacterium]|nr:helix-turn-helix transcriptional regulator [Oscillospiraceae bacterium]